MYFKDSSGAVLALLMLVAFYNSYGRKELVSAENRCVLGIKLPWLRLYSLTGCFCQLMCAAIAGG